MSIQRCHIFFAERKLGFPKGCEDTSGAAFVGALADTLFEILQEPRPERLRLRGIRMPLLFEHFTLKNSQISYNNLTKHRHGQLPPLQRVKLEGLASRL